MKVAVFSTKKYDRDSFDAALAKADGGGMELTFLEVRLDHTTAVLAAGHGAVCIFVNDECGADVLQQLSALGVKYVALRCAGFNNVDVAAAARLGLAVARVPAYSPASVAEFAVGMMLTVVRRYHKSYLRVREGNFLLDGLVGFNLAGRTVGIVGTGRIGLHTAKILAHGFGCTVLAYDPSPDEEAARAHGLAYAPSLANLLRRADIVSLHCPLTPSTLHLVNDTTLAQMKQGVILINTSRGALIDTEALIRSLKSGHLGAVGLDVYEKESAYFFSDSSSKIIQDDNFARLLSFYNVFVSGHQAYLTTEALANIADTTIHNLAQLSKDGASENQVQG